MFPPIAILRTASFAFLILLLAPVDDAAAAAGGNCIGFARVNGGEYLVNRCGDCRMATVVRTRPGAGVPASRKFSLKGHSNFPLPFKGPGHSRLTADLPCKGSVGEAPNLVAPKGVTAATQRKCVAMRPARTGSGIYVENSCQTCKVAAIQRQDRTGQRSSRDVIMLNPGKVRMVPSNGFDHVGLLGEMPCRKRS